MYKNLRTDTLQARLSNDSNADNQSENSLVSEGLITPVGPAAAAAIASSLYGSGEIIFMNSFNVISFRCTKLIKSRKK